MTVPRELFNSLYYNSFVSRHKLCSLAKFPEKEVAETARKYAEGIGYICGDEWVQQRSYLMYQKEKLIWSIAFSPIRDGLPLRGGHLRLLIDDETGEVIKKFVGTR